MRQYFTERVANTFRWLRVAAVMGVMMICCIPTMAQIVPTTDTDGNGTIEDSEKKLYLIQANKFASFYMVAKGNEVNTANLPHSDMLWYFLEAENDSGTQYYYIVNNSTGKYICNTDYSSKGRTIGLLTFDSSSTDKFKFKLVDKTGGFYNISIKPNGGTWIGLNKRGGNVGTEAVRLTDNAYINDGNSKWKFIAFDDSFSWPDPPFTLSPGESKTYYKIHNKQETSYYVSTGSGSPKYVTFSSTVSDDMAWYFVEAPTDNTGMKVRYYYIINPEAEDQYMYFRGNTGTSNQSDAVEVKAKSGENEDRYQFFVVLAARTTGGSAETPVGCYMIVPKLLIGNLWNSNSFGSTSISEGSNMGIISGRANDSKAHWTFEETAYTPHCATPVITFDYTTSMVSISSATPGSTIYYTTNGDTPSTSSSEYSGPFSVTTTTTVKAIATHAGYYDSEIATLLITQVATPTIQDNGSNAISITSATEGATIYYTTDGSTPTTSSTVYTEPLTENVSNVTIKAIAVKENMITSGVGSGSVMLQCATPVITRVGLTFTLSCSMPTDASLYYTLEGGSETTYEGPVSFTTDQLPLTVTAVARHGNYTQSEYATVVLMNGTGTPDDPFLIYSTEDFSTFVDNVNNGSSANACYKLEVDISASGIGAITHDFSGSFDGSLYTISGLGHSLFNVVDGGTVRNVILKEVSISGSGNVGAICNEADGATKIYNCGILSGSVSGGTNTGGLVGLIQAGSSVRVVNCYNFANVSGSGYAAGIVGKNEGTVADDGTVGNVRIALCMMYGNVTDASNISPVYGGNHEDNKMKYLEYNYWRYRAELPYTDLNDQLPVEKDDYLTRFPFFRHILNSHRELAAYFLFGGVSCNDMSDITQDNIDEIGHWAVKKDVAPYPIIEPWPTNTTTTPTYEHNNLPSTTENYAGKLLTEMGTDGYLRVKVVINGTTITDNLRLPITDMDTLGYDFTWGKVVLPFANEFSGWTYDYSKICTGWKITGITGGTEGTFANYNVSDRKCTAKDLYDNTGFIFAQGGNYIVPYGVTAIEITANFATAFYLCDESYEIAYEKDGVSAPPNSSGPSGYTTRTALAGNTPTTYHDQPVYNTLADALDAMTNKSTTHAQAIVLVGNYHLDDFNLTGSNRCKKGYTFMSIDADNNQEPDYAIYSNNTMNRPAIPPTRYDFVAFIPMGMSSHVTGALFYPNTPIWKPRGWFEITETGLMFANQFEIESNNFNDENSINNRCIINGGYFTQMVRGKDAGCERLSYYQIGGKAYIKEFYPGSHSASVTKAKLVPINVTGGEIEQCFMTGYGQHKTTHVPGVAYGPDIYFWCAGGRIHKFLGAYMEPPVESSSNAYNNPGTVNMTAKIDHARIYRFFGGGTTSNARITGNIRVTIDNSFVDFYCGGPEFGDMVTGENGKTVETTANNTTFREYYGAGYGGTAITYTNDEDDNRALSDGYTYPSRFFSNHYGTSRLQYKPNYGIGNCYKYEFIMHSRGHQSVARFYTGYAMFSLAKTGSVTNILTDCTVLESFYGGGCQGTVDGTVTSTLTGCTIHHSAFGGGFKATSNEVKVYTTTYPNPLSSFNAPTGIFSDFGSIPAPETFKWQQGTESQHNTADENAKKLYTGTDVLMDDLGNVTGDIKITLKGNTTVGGNVFGGGNESKSLSNTLVEILGHTKVLGNIYGGGNMGVVGGNTKVVVNGQSNNNGQGTGSGNNPNND